MLSNDVLKKIFFISERVIAFDDMGDVFQHILKTAMNITKASAATMRIFDVDSGLLKIVSSRAISNAFLSQPPLKYGEGILGNVIKQGQYFATSDVTKVNHCVYKELADLEGIKALLSVPLRTQEASIGCITVYRKEEVSFKSSDRLLLEIFAAQAVEAIEKTKLVEELKKQATMDSLTHIYNRAFLEKRIEEEISRAKRHTHILTLIFIDIDGFKNFNDKHGHLLGDKLLADFASLLKKNCRKNDIFGRYGGEEFIIATPEIDKKTAYALTVKLKGLVNSHKFLGKEGGVAGISFSAGIASKPQDGDNLKDLLHRADEAMYRAKKKGKNRVELWSE